MKTLDKKYIKGAARFVFSALMVLTFAIPSLAISNTGGAAGTNDATEVNEEGTASLIIEVLSTSVPQKRFRMELSEVTRGENLEVVIYTMQGQIIHKDIFIVGEGNTVHQLRVSVPGNSSVYIMRAVSAGRNVTKKFHL